MVRGRDMAGDIGFRPTGGTDKTIAGNWLRERLPRNDIRRRGLMRCGNRRPFRYRVRRGGSMRPHRRSEHAGCLPATSDGETRDRANLALLGVDGNDDGDGNTECHQPASVTAKTHGDALVGGRLRIATLLFSTFGIPARHYFSASLMAASRNKVKCSGS